MKSVIHDWDDERSLVILRNSAAAMNRQARLLVIEVVVPERLQPSPLNQAIVGADLNMLVNTGGCERTEPEFRKLLETAGLQLKRILPTPSALSVIEAFAE